MEMDAIQFLIPFRKEDIINFFIVVALFLIVILVIAGYLKLLKDSVRLFFNALAEGISEMVYQIKNIGR